MKITILAVGFTFPFSLLQAQSPLSGLAQGFVVHDTSQGLSSLMIKPPGDKNLALSAEAHPEAPTYTIEALLHHLGANAQSAAVHFGMNAISTGNDILPVVAEDNPSGVPDYWEVDATAVGGWAAVALSVSDLAGPGDSGTVFGNRYGDTFGAGIGSDLFSYWFSDNVNMPPSLTGHAHFDLGYEHFGAGSSKQVTGLDTYMPAVIEARGVPSHVVPVVNKWFFTLTPETAGRMHEGNGIYWATVSNAFLCPLADIGCNYVYWTEWDEVTGWSKIQVEFDPARLGLTEGGDIDAIAFFDMSGFRDRIVFSLSLLTSGNREQLLVGGTGVLGLSLIHI